MPDPIDKLNNDRQGTTFAFITRDLISVYQFISVSSKAF